MLAIKLISYIQVAQINYGSFHLGSLDTTRVLLEAGAKVHAENNLGRTAAQLGAFVGMKSL